MNRTLAEREVLEVLIEQDDAMTVREIHDKGGIEIDHVRSALRRLNVLGQVFPTQTRAGLSAWKSVNS